MRVLDFGCDVKTYMKIIFTIKLEVRCLQCGNIMVYHACYKVNYKSNEMPIKIAILRFRCKNCKVTHSLKPDFLASRHQYDTYERQRYILAYNNTLQRKVSLRKLSDELFPCILVSHTVMYYWIRVVTKKREAMETLIVKEIQAYLPSCDITGNLLPEASNIPAETRRKGYSFDMVKLLNWGRVYIKFTSDLRHRPVTDYNNRPFIYINKILDLLNSHVFL